MFGYYSGNIFPALIWAIVIGIVGWVGLSYLVKYISKRADDHDPHTDSQSEKRARTLGRIINAVGKIVLVFVVVLMTLGSFGVNTAPIWAAGGIVGVAVGLGMQSLAKDIAYGVLILFENRYAEGDRVVIGDFEGVVERVTVRSTILRTGDGKIIFISNGQVNSVINYTLGNVKLAERGESVERVLAEDSQE